jgi:hypothetical protein
MLQLAARLRAFISGINGLSLSFTSRDGCALTCSITGEADKSITSEWITA